MEVMRFIDKWNMIDKLCDPDGGDSAAKMGMYFSLMGMMSDADRERWERSAGWGTQEWFDFIVPKYHVIDGVVIRHVNREWDSSDFDRHSRDQLKPNLIAFGYWSRHELKSMLWGHLKRGFLFAGNTRQNGATKENHGKVKDPSTGELFDYSWRFPDVTLFDFWGAAIRAYKAWWLYPVLWLTDIYLVVGAIKWRFFAKNNITLNFVVTLFQAIDRLPTPWWRLSVWIMPPEKLIELAREHLTDFGKGQDTEFMADMMIDAYKNIRSKK